MDGIDEKLHQEIGALKLQVSLHETSNKELYKRVGELERITDRMDEGWKNIKCSIDEMKTSVNSALESFSDQLKKLQLKPGENWDLSKRTILTSVLSGLVVIALGVAGYAFLQQKYEDKITNMQIQYQQEINNLKLEMKGSGE